MQLHPSEVTKTQILKTGSIWRRRSTLDKKYTYTTYETPTLANIKVLKKNGTSEQFDQFKLFGTIYISFKDEKGEGAKKAVKRAKSVLFSMIDFILEGQKKNISSFEIATLCLKLIKTEDYYAGMRYASRYQR
jgi:transcriptional regulator NrdR family protein